MTKSAAYPNQGSEFSMRMAGTDPELKYKFNKLLHWCTSALVLQNMHRNVYHGQERIWLLRIRSTYLLPLNSL